MRMQEASGWWALMLALGMTILALGAHAGERNEIRSLMDFEDGAELKALKTEGMTLDIVQDNGVTSGANCCRVVGKAGTGWATMEIRGAAIKDWGNFDFFSMDVFTERAEKLTVVFELWDAGSKNYQTRCTFENVQTHVGANKLVWPINRAKRNNKEGREWNELQSKDKIDMNGLKFVKIFFTPFKQGGDTVLWIDNLRLLQEDALGGKINLTLPDGAKAYDLGDKGLLTPGFEYIGPGGAGVSGKGVKQAGKHWPDTLTGDGLAASDGPLTFEVPLADGAYQVWLSAGPLYREQTRAQPYLLKVGDQELVNTTLTDDEFYGEKGIFRHLRTQYSNRSNALWLDYVLPEANAYTAKVNVTGGKLTVTAQNHRLAALIAVPAAEEAAFAKLKEDMRTQRQKYFYNQHYFDKHDYPKKEEGDGAYLLWAPHYNKYIQPWSGPDATERAVKKLDLAGAPGERLVTRLCVSAFEDLGTGELTLSDLKGPGGAVMPAANVRAYYQNYRVQGTGVSEMALLPWTKIRFEPELTWAYWLWIELPADAKPGAYTGSATFTPEKGGARSMPVELTVWPVTLEDQLPVSYGMYYKAWKFPKGIDQREKTKEQLQFMREVGFTATCVGSPRVTGFDGKTKVNLRLDTMMFELAREVGMGTHPDQHMMATSLGMARMIARKLGLSPAVDQQPGIEFTKPQLEALYKDAIRQQHAFHQKMGLPVAVESVDEPRETPNPWNRNLAHTNQYADWQREAVPEIVNFVTPMGDAQSGKDYTSLVDHHSITSVHAWAASKKLIEKATQPGKTIWFYNTGMDRLSWGFYNWRMGSKGRWEWHFQWNTGKPADGYPNPNQWMTPFTQYDSHALHAPYQAFKGGMLFKSSFLNVAQGINDYAYLVTLEKAVATAKDDAAKADAVKRATELLDALKKSIPVLPKVKGLASPEAGALVGAGLDTPAASLCEDWRRKLAPLIAELQK